MTMMVEAKHDVHNVPSVNDTPEISARSLSLSLRTTVFLVHEWMNFQI